MIKVAFARKYFVHLHIKNGAPMWSVRRKKQALHMRTCRYIRLNFATRWAVLTCILVGWVVVKYLPHPQAHSRLIFGR
jgi:hypothetical protein